MHHRSPQVNRHARRAFSLVELIVVMVIMGVLLAIAVPRYAGFVARSRADAAARRVAADLTYARQLSRQSSSSQRVSFSLGLNRYVLVGVPDPDRAGQDYGAALAVEPYRAAIVSADFDSAAEIVFDAYGVPNSGGSVVVAVGNHARQIEVDPATGQISVVESDVGPGDLPLVKEATPIPK